MSAAESVLSHIQHYQRSIEKYHGNSDRILHCINKLYNLPVTVQHLQDTGVGKTINSLRKSEGEVGEAARALVFKWKQMVEEESENEQESVTKSYHNGVSENEKPRERLEKHAKQNSEKYLKATSDSIQQERDHSKSYKRKRESEHEQRKEKRRREEDGSSSAIHNTLSTAAAKGSLNGTSVSDEEWSGDRLNNVALDSADENDILTCKIKAEKILTEGQNSQSSEDDTTRNECMATSGKESWHRKETSPNDHYDRASQKSSSKHKSKSSSSSSDRSKHSTSHRGEHKSSKSSNSSKSKEDRTLHGSTSNLSREGGNDVTVKDEEKHKVKEKSKKDRHKDKHRKKDDRKSSSKAKGNKVSDAEDDDGVDSYSGIGFGEALGMMFSPEKPRKKSLGTSSSSSTTTTKKKSKSSSSLTDKNFIMKDSNNVSPEMDDRDTSSSKILSLEVDEDFGLPALNPNYKPLPQPSYYSSPPKRCSNDDSDDLSNLMYSKVQRTKVWSGNKSGYTSVPSLFDLCTRVLQENIDALEFTGGVPFDLLKSVLERATPEQLAMLEHFNAYLIEDTDIFWETHCKKYFRNKKREEMETWRDMYLRCSEEREKKLESLTKTIAASSKAKAAPVRKTQMAYVEGTVKPPRNIARKQAKFGTARPSASCPSSPSPSSSKQSSSGLSSSFTGRSTAAPLSSPSVSVPPPRGSGSGSQSSSCKPKPKAPLMQKTLQFMKLNRFGKR